MYQDLSRLLLVLSTQMSSCLRGEVLTNNELEALLERARDGESQALEMLLLKVQPQLYRYCLKMCKHSQDAEDVLQDSLISLAKSYKDFRGNSSLSTWLFSVVRNSCLKKHRKSKFAPKQEESLESLSPTEQGQLISKIPDPFQQAEAQELWIHVQEAIQRLEPSYREVLVLRDIEGLRAREVAEVMGLSLPAIKSRLHRARAELRAQFTSGDYRPKAGCPDVRRMFSLHLEGELSSSVCASMEAHVSNCEHCAPECNGLRTILNTCSSSPGEVPKDVQDRVQRSLRKVLSSLSF